MQIAWLGRERRNAFRQEGSTFGDDKGRAGQGEQVFYYHLELFTVEG
jgi:hypothetical protein